ncbi:MAG: T9SS type A sorting domain-containing protein [Candidatus Krumholzibacteria bacterium]|nr:T9SS type A sorting domain-containing protein [Candidatus Krumholzibacteria bacterium]
MTISFTRTAIIISIFLVCSSIPAAAAYYVRYDYTVSAHGDVTAVITDADYLHNQTFVEGEYTQVGDTGAGNYATVKFLADIAAGRIFSFAKVVGVHVDGYNYYGGTARVEHIEIREEIEFSIPPGTYPEGLYADLSGRMVGTCASEVGAGAMITGWVSLGSSVYDTGILSVGIGDAGSVRFYEPIALTVMLASPGSSFSVLTKVTKILSIYHHRNLCWANEYNTGSGYVIGSAENDFYGGIQIYGIDTTDGVTWTSESGVFLSDVSSVDDPVIPDRAPRLFQNHPNPFNPSTKLSFELGAAGNVRLNVYDTAGRLVATLVNERRDAGLHEVIWDGRDHAGRISSAGVYLYRIEVDDYVETKRMTLVK